MDCGSFERPAYDSRALRHLHLEDPRPVAAQRQVQQDMPAVVDHRNGCGVKSLLGQVENRGIGDPIASKEDVFDSIVYRIVHSVLKGCDAIVVDCGTTRSKN